MVEAAHLSSQQYLEMPAPPNGVNKWEVLRELSTARVAFGLSDRDMAVLQALLSFHPETILGGNSADIVVHPSNRSICERLNGMPCSTMRRHLGHLVDAGVILRRDSPNGKRYARHAGDEKIAFGFDLTPLLVRHGEFCDAAETIRAEQDRYRRLREAVSLMRRDLAGLVEYGADVRPDLAIWKALGDLAVWASKMLRRKLSIEAIEGMQDEMGQALDTARNVLEPSNTTIMNTNESDIEQHYQNSNTNSHDSELREENAKAASVGPIIDLSPVEDAEAEMDDTPLPYQDSRLPNIPLGLVLSVCSEFQTYADGPIRHWHDLVRVADAIRPMMGISPSAWEDAKLAMGPEEASVVIVAMLERFNEIKSPGGYLRHLAAKAADGTFSCGPMIMALMRRDAA